MQMSMKINQDLMSTPLPNFFIDNYMTSCNPIFSLIYIYMYKSCLYGQKELSIPQVASHFKIIDSDVINSLKYWQTKGLIVYKKMNDSFYVEFNLPKQNTTVNIKEFGRFPSYTMEELNLYKSDLRIKEMFDFAEDSLGRYLTYSDLNVLFGIYDYLRLSMDVIQVLIAYCVDNGHRNLSYIEKVAIDWAMAGINSVEKAEEKINGMNQLFLEVRKALAVNNLNVSQRELILNWNKKLHMPQELIVEACNVTMMNIGRPNFKYLESVINTWNEKGIKSVQETKNCRLEINLDNTRSKKSNSKNKFANFKQHDWDFGKIEKILQED